MAAHDFKDHHTVVRFSGGVQTVERFGSDVECSHKTKGKFGAGKAVVNSFGDTAHGNAPLVEFGGNTECAFATQDYKGVNSQNPHVRNCVLIDALHGMGDPVDGAFGEVSTIACAEYGAASWQQATDVTGRKETRF